MRIIDDSDNNNRRKKGELRVNSPNEYYSQRE